MNFCENGGGEAEQDGVSLEKLNETKAVCCEEEAVKEKKEEEEMMVKEEEGEGEGDLKEEMVREESDSEEKTESCALIRRSHSNSPEGPERLV